jgi:hypothetical protein
MGHPSAKNLCSQFAITRGGLNPIMNVRGLLIAIAMLVAALLIVSLLGDFIEQLGTMH